MEHGTEQKSLFCSVMGAAPAALRATADPELQQSKQTLDRLQMVPKAWVNTGVSPVLSSVLPLSPKLLPLPPKITLAGFVPTSVYPQRTKARSVLRRSAALTDRLCLSQNRQQSIFGDLLRWLLLWMLLLPCNS